MKICRKCGERFEDARGFCPRDGEVLVKDNAALVGRTLDNQYEIERFIAAGGMGSVYRARHILLGDPVAIKILSPEMSGNAEWLKRFQREGQVARKFRHPNAVLVHDLRTSSDGLVYMVMEFVEGRTLDALLHDRERFSPKEALALLDPIASVLDAAHAMGVVHRDLKPENVMIGQSAVKLLDLGIAKMREIAEGGGAVATSLTVAGQILGTPYYMSPEQWGEISRDGNPEIDSRADIYSLGVMFYELITGRKPFGGATLAELRRGHVSFTPEPLHEVAPDVPEQFSRVITRAISKDRNDRQPTAGKLIEEIRAALNLTASPSLTSALNPTNTQGLPADPATATADFARLTGADLPAPTIVSINNATPPSPSPVKPKLSSETVAQPATGDTSPNAGSRKKYTPPLPTMATSEFAPDGALRPAPVGLGAPPAPPVMLKSGRSSALVLLAIGVFGVITLLGIGLGGWFMWNGFSSDPTEPRKNQAGDVQADRRIKEIPTEPLQVETPLAEREAQAVEIAQWWLNVAPLDGPDDNAERRAAPDIKVTDKETFKFNYLPRESGYLYVLGPDDKGALTTFLTAKPVRDSRVKTNRVEKDEPFSLYWMTRGRDEERYYVVFSTTPLEAPEFFASRAMHKLSAAEANAWDAFLSQNKANAKSEVVNKDGAPVMTVSRVRSAESGADVTPTIFDIAIGR